MPATVMAVCDPRGQKQAAWCYLESHRCVEDANYSLMPVYHGCRHRPRSDA